MRSLLWLVISMALGLPALAHGQGSGEVNAAAFGWLSSLSDGKTRAARDNKPLMVVLRCVP